MSNHPTPKADQVRALREANASGKTSARPSRAALKAATAAVKPSKPTAPAIQPAAETAAPAATPGPERAEQPKESAMRTKSATKKKAAPAAKAPAAKPAKKKAAANARTPVAGAADHSPLAVGTFCCRAGGASMDHLVKQFGVEAHPMRAKIHAAKHKLGFKIEYDAEKKVYVGTAPKAKA